MRIDDEIDRLEKEIRKYEIGDHPVIPWLDSLTFAEISKKRKLGENLGEKMFLYVDLIRFDCPVVYYEDKDSARTTNDCVFDYTSSKMNAVELLHRKLLRSFRLGPSDKDLKPDPKTRDRLRNLIESPLSKAFSIEENDLLWKYRYYLSSDRKSLSKFLRSVSWDDAAESEQAIALMEKWVEIDIEDSLELLSADFTDFRVRSFAASRIDSAEDFKLKLYLLQLVQALRYESEFLKRDGGLAALLIKRGTRSQELGILLYWYLTVEEDSEVGLFKFVLNQFIEQLSKTSDGYERVHEFQRQKDLLNRLQTITKELRLAKVSRSKKIERLKEFISDPENGLLRFSPLRLPLHSTVVVTGIVPEKCTIFKSSLAPLKIVFTCVDSTVFSVIFKLGDDLRQDQLVIQLFNLIDSLLRKENLDLRLTLYHVLATGPEEGLVEYVESSTLASILADNNNSIQAYLRMCNPDESSSVTFGIEKDALDSYIRSCAGYSVITYILGVGDRHLDNLMMCKSGKLFHIDFGFILGRDPKPFPPPMKLCKEMVEAMGGQGSVHYHRFRSLCFVAFMILRKSSNLILNLLSLMIDANISDIAFEPDKAIRKVEEKFRLDLNEEEAIQHFQVLINESVSALFPQMMETIHKWAQYWRK